MIEIVRFTKTDGPLSKRIALSDDGSVISDGYSGDLFHTRSGSAGSSGGDRRAHGHEDGKARAGSYLMRKPRALGAGPVNAGLKTASFGDDNCSFNPTGSASQRRFRETYSLDRHADFLLQQGFHHQAERLSRLADDMRVAG